MTATAQLSKSQQAYRVLRDRIAHRELAPGFRLVLPTIAAELDMSVVPVREAVRRLEAEGLVTYERNVGARVALIDETDYVHAMQTLGLVEGAATALAAPLLGDAALARASEINDRMRQLLGRFDDHAFTELNHRFHEALYEACPNPQLLDLVHRGWTRLAGIRESAFGFAPGRAPHSVAEHEHILALIREGAEPLEIELAVREHRWRTLDAVLLAHHPHHPEG